MSPGVSVVRRLAWLALSWGAVAAAQTPTPISGVNDIQAGHRHACAIDPDGGLRCWGDNTHGQLGNGTTQFTTLPVDVSGLSSGVLSVAAGGRHTCARTDAGEVKCWGANDLGELGDGTTTHRLLPVTVQGLAGGVLQLAAGTDHTCALLVGGSVQCWGYNYDGQLGNGTTSMPTQANPVPQTVLNVSGAQSITSFGEHTCARFAAGNIKCWGRGGAGQLGDGTGFSASTPVDVLDVPGGAVVTAYVEVVAGLTHTCAIDAGGGVWCWGLNDRGELGDGTDFSRLNPFSLPTLVSGAQQLDLGDGFSCAKLAGGIMKCWGDNSYGQIGDGTHAGEGDFLANGVRPVPTTGVIQDFVHQLAVGAEFACARTQTTVQCWGRNRAGELGDGRGGVLPRAGDNPGVQGLSTVQKIVGRGDHYCSLSSGGLVHCWGANHYGELGDGTDRARTVPVPVASLSGVLKLGSGTHHMCAVMPDSTARCWGANHFGSFGDGTTTSSATPVPVLDAAGSQPLTGVVSISGSGSHTCALRGNGGVMCWGNRTFGRVGDGLGGSPQLLPVDVLDAPGGSPLLGLDQVSSAQNHVCARTTGGGVKCWGRNDNGRLGDGTTTHRGTPVDVLDNAGAMPLSGVAQISMGSNHSCVLTTIGTVKCWGLNNHGQLGNGTTTDALLPVDVVGLPPGVNELLGGSNHACARNGGQVRCWGDNQSGQLGDGTTTDRSLPTLVLDIDDAVHLAAAFESTCAVRNGGRVHCWGWDHGGMLGFGNRDFGVPGDVLVFEAPRRVAPVTPAADEASVAPQSDAAGRYVVFQSSATNLLGMGGDANGGSDVYVVDRDTGDVVRASVNDDGSESGGGAVEPSVSADGTLVSFVAPDAAITKVHGESKAAARRRTKQGTSAIFLRNLITGTTQRMGLALPAAAGTKPRLSATGRAIVYTAINTDPAMGTPGQKNVFRIPLVQDNGAYVPQPLECVSCQSRDAMGLAAGAVDGDSQNAAVSANGRFIVYETKAGNAIAGVPSPCPNTQIMLRDLIRGFSQRIAPPPGTTPLNCGTEGSTAPSIDWAGYNIAFGSDAGLKPGVLPGTKSIYAGDRFDGALERLSETEGGGAPDGGSGQAVMSGDGNTVVWVSDATNLDPSFADTNNVSDVYAASRPISGRLTGGRAQRLSRTVNGGESNAAANNPALNYNATQLVFDSAASNLVPGDGNDKIDVFLRAVPANADIVFATGFE